MSESAREPLRSATSVDTVDADGMPFFSRWSRRKLGREDAPEDAPEVIESAPEVAAQAEIEDEVSDPIDPRTGKPRSELTDDDMPDVETLDANADVSMFFGGKVSAVLRNRALAKVFSNPKFNVWCVCAEYAEDYTNFTPMGDIVPHDLKQAIAREAGKLYERLTEKGLQITPEQAEARMAAQFRGEALAPEEIEFPVQQASADSAELEADVGTTARVADQQSDGAVPSAKTEET